MLGNGTPVFARTFAMTATIPPLFKAAVDGVF
jgi:hypothetical protein